MGRQSKNAAKANAAAKGGNENKVNNQSSATLKSCNGCPLARVNPKNQNLQTCKKRMFAFSVNEKGLPDCK